MYYLLYLYFDWYLGSHSKYTEEYFFSKIKDISGTFLLFFHDLQVADDKVLLHTFALLKFSFRRWG